MVTITQNTIVQQSPNFLSQYIDDEVVMISIDQGAYYALDDIGSMIWEQIKQPIHVVALCQFLTDHSDATFVQCREDVLIFLNELSAEGMLNAS